MRQPSGRLEQAKWKPAILPRDVQQARYLTQPVGTGGLQRGRWPQDPTRSPQHNQSHYQEHHILTIHDIALFYPLVVVPRRKAKRKKKKSNVTNKTLLVTTSFGPFRGASNKVRACNG